MDDASLLSDVDLSRFSDAEREKIVQSLYQKLEDRVGDQVTAIVSDEQFEQFEALVDTGNEEKLDEWLDSNVPNYDQLVSAQLEQLKTELRTDPQAFLTAS
jgi:hypothetical protein